MTRETIVEGPEPHPLRFVGQVVSFDLHRTGGKTTREKGEVVEQKWIGFTTRGRIPEYQVTIVGKTGRAVLARVTEDHVTPL